MGSEAEKRRETPLTLALNKCMCFGATLCRLHLYTAGLTLHRTPVNCGKTAPNISGENATLPYSTVLLQATKILLRCPSSRYKFTGILQKHHLTFIACTKNATLRQAAGMGPLKPFTHFSLWSSLCPRPGNTGTRNNY